MLLEPLLRHARNEPDRIAVIDESGSYTNQALARMAFGLGAFLKTKTSRGTVGLLLPAGAGFVAGFYGTLLANKVPVPINFLMGAREVAHILQDSQIDTVLTHPLLAGRLEGLGVNVVDLSQLAGQLGDVQPYAPPEHGPDDLATLLYTSGTTGLPKGVMLTQNNLHADVHACIDHVKLTGDHRFLGIVPLFHSTGLLATMIAPITLGARVVYIGRFSPVATLKAIREHGISVLIGVPAMYGAVARLKDASAEDFSQMFACVSGGEPLPTQIREAFLHRFNTRIMEGYGLTETIGPVAFNTPVHYRAGSVGRLIPGAEVRFVDDNDQTLSHGETGEILLRGPMIMKGYHDLPAETATALTPDGFFRTGDLGHIDPDGFLFITGRKKDVIIIAGEKVYPREIEELLAAHPDLADVAIVGRKDESRGEAVVAFVVPREGQTVTLESIRDFLRGRETVNWKIPKEVHVVSELPRSPTGKVLKRELVQKLTAAN